MAIDSATLSFLEKLNQDSELQDQLQATVQAAQDKTGAVLELAKSKGFVMGRESFEEARNKLNAAKAGELGERQLEGVVGGFNPQPEPPGGVSSIYTRFRKNLLSW
jgi:hypothetical protein